MKGMNLKLFSIFIILIFCLAPLNALDLNQDDNNTKYTDSVHKDNLEIENSTFVANDTDSVEVKDVNITADEIKNKTSKNDEQKTANETMKSLSNKTKSLDEREDSYVQLVISDVHPGDDIYIFVNALPTFTDDVTIKTSWSNEVYNVHVKEGFAYIVVKNDLPVGTYKATVKFDGNDEFIPRESTKTFRVIEKKQYPVDPNLRAYLRPAVVEKGNPAFLEIYTDASINDKVKVKLNTSTATPTVEIKDGYGNITFSNLDVGEYTVTVTYAGNKNFSSSEVTKNFTVREKIIKPDPDLSMTINDVYEGDKIFAEVHTNKTYSGYVGINIDDIPGVYSVRIDDGYGNKNISEKLAPGKHNATAVFYETPEFAESTKTYSFQVNKHDEDLSVGEHIATARYDGNKKFNPSENSTSFMGN